MNPSDTVLTLYENHLRTQLLRVEQKNSAEEAENAKATTVREGQQKMQYCTDMPQKDPMCRSFCMVQCQEGGTVVISTDQESMDGSIFG